MRVSEWRNSPASAASDGTGAGLNGSADLVFVFGSRGCLEDGQLLDEVRTRHPNAVLTGCSTAGEISDVEVSDNSATVVAVAFDYTTVKGITVKIGEPRSIRNVGEAIAKALLGPDLSHVFILSEGTTVNGSELVAGLTDNLPKNVGVTGGLAGDGAEFANTLVVDERGAHSGVVRAVGLYGQRLVVGYGSRGGWDTFGPERLITRSEGNVLYELDHKPALEVYRAYLGEYAAGLPATGLLFPLAIRSRDGTPSLVRTLLAVDEEVGSLTFAGDLPMGGKARLMKSNFDRLVEGASRAASEARDRMKDIPAELSILISCVGRKLMLIQRIEEEVEVVREVVGDRPLLTGFYSYGEVCPHPSGGAAVLHNQTMTITSFAEI
jgi:hypothetical protein